MTWRRCNQTGLTVQSREEGALEITSPVFCLLCVSSLAERHRESLACLRCKAQMPLWPSQPGSRRTATLCNNLCCQDEEALDTQDQIQRQPGGDSPGQLSFQPAGLGDVILWRVCLTLTVVPHSPRPRKGDWSLARRASRRTVLPYGNLSIPTRLFSVVLGSLRTWDILWNLAKHPTKEEGMYQTHP